MYAITNKTVGYIELPLEELHKEKIPGILAPLRKDAVKGMEFGVIVIYDPFGGIESAYRVLGYLSLFDGAPGDVEFVTEEPTPQNDTLSSSLEQNMIKVTVPFDASGGVWLGEEYSIDEFNLELRIYPRSSIRTSIEDYLYRHTTAFKTLKAADHDAWVNHPMFD